MSLRPLCLLALTALVFSSCGDSSNQGPAGEEVAGENDGKIKILPAWDDTSSVSFMIACIDTTQGATKHCDNVEAIYRIEDKSGILVEEDTPTSIEFVYDDEHSAEDFVGRTSECAKSTCTFWSLKSYDVLVPDTADIETLTVTATFSKTGGESFEVSTNP